VPQRDGGVYVANYTAEVLETAELGVLTSFAVESVLGDMTRLSGTVEISSSAWNANIKLEDLTKHRILGVGTFGKVWFVTDNTEGKKVPYALKIQKKRQLIDSKQVNGVLREKSIMAQLYHPFIINLVNTYQDDSSLFMLMDLVQGGELFALMNKGQVAEKDTKFFCGSIFEGLIYMHDRNILYRDLKAENVLIAADGYPIIIDLGFAKVVTGKTYTLCGTPLYLAPEVILSKGYDKSADLWSWMVLAYEMRSGGTPFYERGMGQMDLFKRIIRAQYVVIPGMFSPYFEDLIAQIFVTKPNQRLGSFSGGDRDIKSHAWFSDFDFDAAVKKTLPVSYKPKVKNALDVSAFDNWDHMAREKDGKALTKAEQDFFADF